MRKVTSVRTGSLIGAAFGLVYIVSNAGSLPSGAAIVLRGLGVAAFVGLLIAIRRTPPTRGSGVSATGGFGRGYWLVVAAEVAAVISGALLLAAGYRDMAPRGDHPDIKMSGARVTRR